MPAVPHPCFDPLGFYLDTGTSLVYHRIDPDGGLYVGSAGLAAHSPKLHIGADDTTMNVPGDAATGLVNPSFSGPLSAPINGDLISNPFDKYIDIIIMGGTNALTLAPEAASETVVVLDVSADGVTYKRVSTVGTFSDAGSTRSGNYTLNQYPRFTLAPGGSFTPVFLVSYDLVGGDHADFVKVSKVIYSMQSHTV